MSATANLRRDAPGYARLDAAREALADGDLTLARQEAEAAASLIADEPLVDAVLGDIEMASDQPARAVDRYEAALSRNNQFFYFHLAKADAHLALDQISPAETAYQSSITLLPTAAAYLGLGRVAEARGDIPLAIEQYARAAESSGQAGIDARRAAIRLDLPSNPERYLSVSSSLDSSGRLNVEIGNPTEFQIGGIELTVSYLEGGQARLARRTLDGTLAAGATGRLATGLGPFVTSSAFEVAVTAVNVVNLP